MTINFSELPHHYICLRDLDSFTQIKDIFRKLNIQRYIYIFKHKGKIIKIGISHAIQEPADRVYTQIGHMPGWSRPLLKRSKKTKESIDLIISKIEGGLVKDDVEIEVIDFTDYDFVNTDNVYAEMQNAEEALKKDHFHQFGYYPIGNIKQEKIRFVPDKNVLHNLFSFE